MIWMAFLFSIVAFLIGIHALVYDFWIRNFGVQSSKTKTRLRITLELMFLGFIASLFLSRIESNIFTKVFSLVAGFWLGFLLDTAWIILLSYLLVAILKIFHKKILGKYLVILVTTISLIYSGFGVWQVFHPGVREVAVKIDNLAPQWQGKKIVQISDLHLGPILQENFLRHVVEQINQLDPELVVITGDLLDGSSDGISDYIKLLDDISSQQGTYFITGNHEGYRGTQDSLAVLSKTNIRILDDEIVDLGGLQLIGISYPGFGSESNIRETIENNPDFDPEETNILLFHSPTSIGSSLEEHSSLYWKPSVDFQDARDLDIELQLSGHTHQGQIFPFTWLTKWIYQGYEYGLHQIGDFQIYITSGTGVWGPTLRTGGKSEIVVLELQ